MRRDDPALPRVIQAVRPLVLPKLREENERANGRAKSKAKKKGVKDVVMEGQWQWNMFQHYAAVESPCCKTNEDACSMEKLTL